LKGRRIEVRPLQADDFDALFEAASDPLIWEQHPEPDRYELEVFQRFFDGAMASKGAFAVIDCQSGRIIGSSRYYGYDPARREVMIGFTFLERKFWGSACNRELKSLMLDHAFQFVDRVLFEVGAGNIRSQKALEKIGARFLATKELPLRDGTMLPCVVFVIEKKKQLQRANRMSSQIEHDKGAGESCVS
jgi:RimJ/RimL family protein N-acetyltransferase